MSWLAGALDRATAQINTNVVITVIAIVGIAGGLCLAAIINWLVSMTT
ncbi:MAG TPA: hypothetical protein PLK06_00640 [bacterium]|nr:hypothetical protein [bacterium]